MEAALEFARQRGALVSCNHPKPYGPDWDFRQVTNFDCLEVWNGPWFLFNQQALDYWLSVCLGAAGEFRLWQGVISIASARLTM